MSGRIIENHRAFSEDKYNKFETDYLIDEIDSKKLIDKYDLSRKEYREYCGEVYKRTGFKRPPARKKPRNYYYDKTNKRYVVFKKIKGTMVYYGYYKQKSIAKLIVEKLNECDWDKEQLENIREMVYNGI